MPPPIELGFKMFGWLVVDIAIPGMGMYLPRPVGGVNVFHVSLPFMATSEEDERFCAFGEKANVRLKMFVQVTSAYSQLSD